MIAETHPALYYPMLPIHVGTDNTARGGIQQIKTDYMAMGIKVEETLILSVKRRGMARNRHILKINM